MTTTADSYNEVQFTQGKLRYPHITALTECFQKVHGLTVDGMAGPKTIAAIEATMTDENDPDQQLAATGRGAVDVATSLWERDIYDPKPSDTTPNAAACKTAIDNMIRIGLGWTWEPPYAGDGSFEWCGAFVAKCWTQIAPELRKAFFASTYRLDRFCRYQSIQGYDNPKPASGPYRLIADLDERSKTVPWEPRAGDVILIGPSGYGQHICLVESFDASTGTFNTIEGNGTGTGPNGERQQGVVKAARKLGGFTTGWHVRRLLRFAPSDLRI